jgi:hypothetical protein
LEQEWPQQQRQQTKEQQESLCQGQPVLDRSPLVVGGRLQQFYINWTALKIDKWILQTIRHGLRIRFLSNPPLKNHPTPIIPYNVQQKELLDEEIESLMKKGAIEVTPNPLTPGFYSNMFVIPKKNGGRRPVFNLKKLNQFLHAPHFKMETIQEVTKLMKKNNYMTSIDLSDAFLHIPVHPQSRKYLRFHWQKTTYQFCTTPFGLSLVPWLFTKITKPILEWARSQQIRISAYLDDWIVIGDNVDQTRAHTLLLIQKLETLGWIINQKKSSLIPKQKIEHLGFLLDTEKMTAQLPGKKLRDIQRSIQQVLKHPVQTPRKIHSLTMRIQAATFALIPARLYTQYLLRMKNQSVKNSEDWDKEKELPKECIRELEWWKKNIRLWNGKSILPQTPQQVIYVDASDSGWGCSLVLPGNETKTAYGHWNYQEAQMSINWRELQAAFIALKTFPDLCNMRILIRTDNTTSMSYLNKQGGTRSLPLMELATTLWKWCLQRGITVQSNHIPGVLNTQADFESRRPYAKNNWMIHPATFQDIQHVWGENDVDLFADRNTTQLEKYVSWLPDPGSIYVDAFSIPWKEFKSPYLNPPWNLINRCLQKLIQEKITQATMITPWWPTAIWFPIVQALAIGPPIQVPIASIHLPTPTAIWPIKNKKWKLVAWRLSVQNMNLQI